MVDQVAVEDQPDVMDQEVNMVVLTAEEQHLHHQQQAHDQQTHHHNFSEMLQLAKNEKLKIFCRIFDLKFVAIAYVPSRHTCICKKSIRKN